MGLECLKQVPMNRTVIDRVIKTQEVPRDGEEAQRYREFLACSYKKQGFQSDDGKMRYDNIVDFLGRFYTAEDLQGLDACKSVTGTDDGDLAVNNLDCILNYLKSVDKKHEERKKENHTGEEDSIENTI